MTRATSFEFTDMSQLFDPEHCETSPSGESHTTSTVRPSGIAMAAANLTSFVPDAEL